MNYDEILPRLLVGSYPKGPEDLELLQGEEGVTAILSLQTDDDLRWLGLEVRPLEEACLRLGIVYRRAPVADMDSQELRARLADCARALDELLAAGHKVYLHCTAGAGRSPSVAIAWLVWRAGWELAKAHSWVVERRPSSPDLDAIRAAISARPVLESAG